MDNGNDSTRPVMKDFWDEHSQDASIQEMMLDKGAEDLSKDELPEILSYLPDYSNLDIIDLGAGIGRFTGQFAEKARKVLSVDFVEKFIEKSKELNKKYTNIDYLTADVMDLNLESNGWDIVFSNWLYMYLDAEELRGFLQNILTWLRIDGYMFCRESCNFQSGDMERTTNPTYYRTSEEYESLFSSVTVPTEDGQNVYGFKIVSSRPVETYIKKKHNENQIIWLAQKVRRDNKAAGIHSLKIINGKEQIYPLKTDNLEKIYGAGFIKTGGIEFAQMLSDMLNLQQGQTVLDVKCGIGGFATYIAKKYGTKVVASDVSSVIIDIARERAMDAGVEHLVEFEVSRLTKRTYASEQVDVIFCREGIETVTDKARLFQKFLTCLKPGGKLLITDFCISEDENDDCSDCDVFTDDCDSTSVPTTTQEKETSACAIEDLLIKGGFHNVSVLDKTEDILHALEKELKTVQEQDCAECVESLTIRRQIVNKLKSGQTWNVFVAEKPSGKCS